MSESLTSEFDVTADPINRLWRISRLGDAVAQRRLLLEVPPLPDAPLAQTVMQAVSRHLNACASLGLAELEVARVETSASLAAWDRAIAEIGAIDPQMVARAHAFHARLASRHQDAYRDFARKQLLDLARCARLKTASISAETVAATGDLHRAAELLDDLSTSWRADLPIRLPGLRDVELAAAERYAASGDAGRARNARDRAATISGVMNDYPEDAPESWPSRPSQEELLRFAFAATRLPASLEMAGRNLRQNVKG